MIPVNVGYAKIRAKLKFYLKESIIDKGRFDNKNSNLKIKKILLIHRLSRDQVLHEEH